MPEKLYFVQITKNYLGPAGRSVHSRKEDSPNGIPHLIVDTYDRIKNEVLPPSMIHAIVEYSPTDEPIVSVGQWLEWCQRRIDA